MSITEMQTQAAIRITMAHLRTIAAWVPTATVEDLADCSETLDAVLAELGPLAGAIALRRLATTCPAEGELLDGWVHELAEIGEALNVTFDRLLWRARELAMTAAQDALRDAAVQMSRATADAR